ncbi:MAG: hypothetical protein AAFY31_00465 [Pseudomonadota bacterium]
MNALHEFAEVPEAYTGCITRKPNKLILHCFPSFGTRLQRIHKTELDNLARQIGTRDRFRKRVSAIWIEGHAARWKRTPEWKYERNARARAVAARAYLERALADERLSYRPRIETSSMADLIPLVPNMKESASKQARRKRSINRRVEILVDWA